MKIVKKHTNKGNKTMIDIQNAWRVELTTTQDKILVQYVEASGVDNAEKIARNTFEARFYKFKAGSMTQKACDKSLLKDESLRFGSKGNWNTLHNLSDMTIFEAVKKAANCFGDVQEITAITNASASGL